MILTHADTEREADLLMHRYVEPCLAEHARDLKSWPPHVVTAMDGWGCVYEIHAGLQCEAVRCELDRRVQALGYETRRQSPPGDSPRVRGLWFRKTGVD